VWYGSAASLYAASQGVAIFSFFSHPRPFAGAPAQPSPKREPPLPINLQHCSVTAAFRTRASCGRIAELNMSLSGSASGGAFKRKREQEVEKEQPASLQVTAYAEPLMLQAMVKSHHDMLVWLQLCNQQGIALFSFVRLPPRVSRPFAGAPV